MNRWFRRPQASTTVAAGILVLLIGLGAIRFEHFASFGNLANLVGDYAFVGVAAVGATFVILSGGVDLSVGSLVAFTAVAIAVLVDHGWHPLAAATAAFGFGTLAGAVIGMLVWWFDLPPFLMTLIAMFAFRAGGFLLSSQATPIMHPFMAQLSSGYQVSVGGTIIPARSLIFLAFAGAGALTLARTRFGRQVCAVGGSRRSAAVMGVGVGPTLVGIYSLAGAASALAGVVFAFGKQAGDPTAAGGLELTVIAAVVIGGTLLSGGVGSVLGTGLGVLILGAIRLLIDFQGDLNPAWTSIATGLLLLGFVLLQKLLGRLRGPAASPST